MNGGNTGQARKAEILRRIQAGEKLTHIAREVGVSKQYVSWLGKFSKKVGAEATIAGRRGRPKDKELTEEETQALRAQIVSIRPDEDLPPGNLWRPDQIKLWFKQTYGRTLSNKLLCRVCKDAGLRLAPSGEFRGFLNTMDLTPESSSPPKGTGTESPRFDDEDADLFGRKRGRPKKSDDFETTRMSDQMMQKILKANAEAAEIMARAREREAAKQSQTRGADPITPVRLGPKIGRNDPCPFDPTIKFKRCCGATGAVRCARQAS
jgi:hypothetical protein